MDPTVKKAAEPLPVQPRGNMKLQSASGSGDCRPATRVRDENLEARDLAGAGKLKEERTTRTYRERTCSILELSGPAVQLPSDSSRWLRDNGPAA